MAEHRYDIVWPLIHMPGQRHFHLTMSMEPEAMRMVCNPKKPKEFRARLRFCEKVRATATERYRELSIQPVIFDQLTITLDPRSVAPPE